MSELAAGSFIGSASGLSTLFHGTVTPDAAQWTLHLHSVQEPANEEERTVEVLREPAKADQGRFGVATEQPMKSPSAVRRPIQEDSAAAVLACRDLPDVLDPALGEALHGSTRPQEPRSDA